MGAEALHRWSRADICFQEALSATPDDSTVLSRAARFYLRVDQPQRAEPLLRRLLGQSLVLSEEETQWARRQLALLLNDPREAGGLLDQKTDPLLPESAANERVRALILASQSATRANAVRTLMESAVRSVMSPNEQLRLARILMAADAWLPARDLMQDLLARDKANPAYLAQFVYWLLERGYREEAALWMDRLEDAAPDDSRTISLRKHLKMPNSP
jgi:predicted Zn-dependent protease